MLQFVFVNSRFLTNILQIFLKYQQKIRTSKTIKFYNTERHTVKETHFVCSQVLTPWNLYSNITRFIKTQIYSYKQFFIDFNEGFNVWPRHFYTLQLNVTHNKHPRKYFIEPIFLLKLANGQIFLLQGNRKTYLRYDHTYFTWWMYWLQFI